MYAILYTEGIIDVNEVYKECRLQKWAPILTYSQGNSIRKIPVFHDPLVAQNFAKRNIPRDWLHGSVFLTDPKIEVIRNCGFIFDLLNFPRLIKDLPNMQFEVEIISLNEVPKLFYHR